MSSGGESCLGICFADTHLYYSVNSPGQDNHLARIGCIDFSFNVKKALLSGESSQFQALQKSLEELKNEFSIRSLKIVLPAPEECWAIVPRSAYEVASEREAHIQLLMKGAERSSIHATWHSVSKNDCHLLTLRDQSSMSGLTQLLSSFGNIDIVSDFEIASDWRLHTGNNGAFIMVDCQQSYISITSYVLGKLRSCTYFEYDHMQDIPYLWNLYASNMPWLAGIHDQILVYGHYAEKVTEQLSPYWHDHGERIPLNSLDTIGVHADEQTYGFQLESAFPAILVSLNR